MPPVHQRLSITGRLLQADGGGSEIFDFGMACASGMSSQAFAEAAMPVVRDYFGGQGGALLGPSAIVTGVRVESIAADGRVGSSYYVATGDRPGRAGNDAPTLLSSAVTLETNTPGSRGRMVRGRFYPPASFAVQGSTTNVAAANAWANAWSGLVNGLNDIGAHVSVASTTNGGVIAEVTAVTVDTVIDTVRRRKNHVTSQRSERVAIQPSS